MRIIIMYHCVSLNKKNFEIFKKLNRSNNSFNNLNKDFFETYNKCNFAAQMILKRKVKLLKRDFDYIGYVWFDMKDKNNCSINSLNVPRYSSYLPYKILIDTLRYNCNISYLCENNQYNFEILKNIGFRRKDGTLMLSYDIKNHMPLIQQEGLEFEIFKIGIDEKRRCDIQNEVFNDNVRSPLTLEDIYFDEIQNYYVHKGSVFLKRYGEYIGYGQIIIEDNTPLIVNFGILKEYRGNGYSKSLISYLLNIVKYNNFNEVKIKVKASNTIALNLYKNLGFKTISQRYKWELRK
jgi:ribosomal protein S18 acetylase RimI-like enzyme